MVMLASPVPQFIDMDIGQDLTINASMDPAESISGWTISFLVWLDDPDSIKITKTTVSGITVTSAANGVIAIDLNAADTEDLRANIYSWRIVRTNAGSITPLAKGTLTLNAP